MIDRDLAYLSAVHLMQQSDYHSSWGDAEMERCIIPPIEMGQYVLGYNENAKIAEPYIFATYAFPEQSHIDEYLSTRMFPKDGFSGKGDDPWVVDFICLSGIRNVLGAVRYMKSMFVDLGYNNAHWLRTVTNRRGWHVTRGV